jgi:hypothetical protein
MQGSAGGQIDILIDTATNTLQLAAFQKAAIEKWWPIIKAANIKPK